LAEHHDDRQGDATEFLLDRPAVDQHAGWDHDAQERETGPQSVFGNAVAASFLGPLDGNVVGVSAAEKRADYISTTGCEIEESGLDGRGEVEAGVEDVADRGKKRIHVPDQRRGCQSHHYQIRVPVETYHAPWVEHSPQDGCLFLGRQSD